MTIASGRFAISLGSVRIRSPLSLFVTLTYKTDLEVLDRHLVRKKLYRSHVPWFVEG